MWLYGGDRPDDERASKAARLELQGLGLASTSHINELNCPLMALVWSFLACLRARVP